jgi:hypothetical protein
MPLVTAIRVLTAVTDRKHPQAADVDYLRRFALPSEANLKPDELASEIIKRELAKRRSEKP